MGLGEGAYGAGPGDIRVHSCRCNRGERETCWVNNEAMCEHVLEMQVAQGEAVKFDYVIVSPA